MKRIIVTVSLSITLALIMFVIAFVVIDNTIGVSRTFSWAEGRYHFLIDRYGGYKPRNKNVCIEQSRLPIVYIEVNERVKKDNSIVANVRIVDKGILDYEGQMRIKYRGHASYTIAEKKSYSLRPIDETTGGGKNISILGSRKNKKWCLLAQHIDRSMIREAISYELTRHYLSGVPQIRFCEVVLNGTYYGMYILSDQPTRKSLHLTKSVNSPDDVSGSYLLYFSRPGGADYTAFASDKKYYFQVKYPDIEEMNAKRKKWLDKRIEEMIAALADTTSTKYRKFIDEKSFIDFQLSSEFAHNTDAYFCSGFMYKDIDEVDSTFKMHLWDVDHSFGMGQVKGYAEYNNWVWEYFHKEDDFSEWWYLLNHNKAYRLALKERWKEWRQGAYSDASITATIDSIYNIVIESGAIKRNNEAWEIWNEKESRQRNPPHVKYLSDSYSDEVQYIKDWIGMRLKWMDSQLLFE